MSFSEYYAAVGGDKAEAFEEYAFYGGMPLILSRPDEPAKMDYLKSLFSEVYLKDIVERKKIKREDVLSAVLDLICSSVGSLTNPNHIANAFNSKRRLSGEDTVAANTVTTYISHLADAYLFEECRRFDVKGKDYFDYGTERNKSGRQVRDAREIDFVAAKGGKKTYIQSAYALETEEKSIAENKPFSLTGDSFPKSLVRHDIRKRWYDENGVLNIGIIDFLFDETIV